ncbi:MAG: hypothetical protein CO186_05240 [Zetaproteobacteria bacterium CG_4_9_14_3_um_filter_49_83]|nr:MAG: hypothetical protein AUJ56_11390 [Zetaproteobacteria bacterium CG1_02_49_23]PIQ33029.1 MAG: hypothetical protein COW62_06450 [Zetaproteobacteria bacterium CG17_big_fil_post_rev_8_21_14_2_50_50_13]PIY55186.1 MAG: hypothetical protein COZ00_10785 [Zetaproteobacteria bacterium CG_4_10_14_0_8_um_filter_49_80]PJA35555.1 MAG: hypothetical protein CO186_05240 [Zetaproteobacteria bacterium CG_4_9_14_3_um_filter_49_83]
MNKRLITHDVTNTVNVSDWQAVRDEVLRIFSETYPGYDSRFICRAYEDAHRFFIGESKLFCALETPYHDVQHSLDMTLALARLISGFEKTVETHYRMGSELATIGLIAGLYHDSGYLRRIKDRRHFHGAEYTKTHISRGIQFMAEYFPGIGLHGCQHVIEKILHFTGYELAIHHIRVGDSKHFNLGAMLGTADLLAQMSDRCYLEKCRDRLFEEFVIAGMATRGDTLDCAQDAIYGSAEDLLRKTPGFVRMMMDHRMGVEFRNIHKYMNCYFPHKQNPYMEIIKKNIWYIEKLIEAQDFSGLRRKPGWTLSVTEQQAIPGSS